MIGLFLEYGVNWDPKSDALAAMILHTVFSKDMRAHSCGVYEYRHGTWHRTTALSFDKVMQLEAALGKSQILFGFLMGQGELPRAWSDTFTAVSHFDWAKLQTPIDQHIFNNAKSWQGHAGAALRALPSRFTCTSSAKTILDTYGDWFHSQRPPANGLVDFEDATLSLWREAGDSTPSGPAAAPSASCLPLRDHAGAPFFPL